jgi:putative Ca2+/H+ antiporter (TMEM165/GDT1 family)
MREVEEELEHKEEVELLESTERGVDADAGVEENGKAKFGEGVVNLMQLLFSPTFVQTFLLTFLAEWGDRSQIATIALGAANNVYFVTFGTIIGHSICTAVAVIGGRMLASRISVRKVTLVGAGLFICFSIVYLYEGVYGL